MPTPESVKLLFTAFAILLTLGVFVRPIYGLMGYTIIMMLRPGLLFPAMAAIRIELLAGLFLIMLSVIKGVLPTAFDTKSDDILKWFWWFIGIILASMIFSFDFSTSWDSVYDFFKVVVFFMLVVSIPSQKSDVLLLVWTVCITSSCISYDAIFNFITGSLIISTGGERVDYAVANTGMGSGHVALANLLLQVLPLIWYMGVCSKSWAQKTLGIPLFFLGLYGVLVSGSRGGFMGLVCFFTCVTLFSKRRLLLGFISISSIIAIPSFMGQGYSTYMNTLANISGDVSSSSRISGLQHGFEMLLSRPLFGVGLGCYGLARKAWMGWGLWAHNTYGELMGELGLAGLIVWPLYVYAYMKRSFVVRRMIADEEIKNLLLGIAVATFVRLFLGMGTHSLTAFFWYLMGGMVIAITRITMLTTPKAME